MRKNLLKIITLSWILLMVVISTVKQAPGGFYFPHMDKIVHFVEYFVLSVLLLKNFLFQSSLEMSFKKTLILGGAFAIFLEIYQFFIPWRSFAIYDILTNLLGLLTGLYISVNLVGWINRKINSFAEKL